MTEILIFVAAIIMGVAVNGLVYFLKNVVFPESQSKLLKIEVKSGSRKRLVIRVREGMGQEEIDRVIERLENFAREPQQPSSQATSEQSETARPLYPVGQGEEAASDETPTIPSLAPLIETEDEQPPYPRRETLITIAALLLVTSLVSLDLTTLATAMPRVVAELHDFNYYTTARAFYLLASTVTLPIWGKLSDVFGRKPIVLFGLIVFLLGSALSGMSQSMTQLIVFHSIEGIGTGAIMPVTFAIITDMSVRRQRGTRFALAGGILSLSTLLGPLLGGVITQVLSWRWVFYINLPIGVVAFFLLIIVMPQLPRKATLVSFDYLGSVLVVTGTVLLLLGFTWAGTEHNWLSAQIIDLFVGAVIVLATFIMYEAYVERKGGNPFILPSLFLKNIFAISTIVTLISTLTISGTILFVPLFVQEIVGVSPINSGLILMPLLLTNVVSSSITGQFVDHLGKYKLIAILGMLMSILGTLLLVDLDATAGSMNVVLAVFVVGLGVGSTMLLCNLIVYNALPGKVGQTSSMLTFFRSLGAAVGVATMGSIMNSTYPPAFQNMVKQIPGIQSLPLLSTPQALFSRDALLHLRAELAALGLHGLAPFNAIIEAMKTSLAWSIHTAFLLNLILMFIGLVSLLFLKEIPFREQPTERGTGAGDGEAHMNGGAHLTEESLAALLY
jgi:EmrB/QacA subfamily drug resistance transporter